MSFQPFCSLHHITNVSFLLSRVLFCAIFALFMFVLFVFISVLTTQRATLLIAIKCALQINIDCWRFICRVFLVVSSLKICMESEEAGRRTTTRNRKPNITLDKEGVASVKLRSLKKTRRGHLSNVTANVNGVQELLSDDRNLQEVKGKLRAAEEAFLKFKDAHLNYAAEIGSEENEVECGEYFTRGGRKFRDFYWTTSDWITKVEANLVTQSLQVDSEVKPEDSVSCAGVGSPARASRANVDSSFLGMPNHRSLLE